MSAITHSTTCLNCSSHLIGNFCHQCGQNTHVQKNPHAHDLAHEVVHEFLHLDGKIFRTLKTLLFFPGQLTVEFLNGQRARSIGAIRLYLTMSLLYFFVSASLNHKTEVRIDKKDQTTKIVTNIDTGNDYLNRKLQIYGEKISASPQQLVKNFTSAFPKFIFLLVPLFAFVLQLFFRKKGYNYPTYLYYSLHLHAAFFAMLLITTATEPIFDLGFLMLLWVFWYPYKSMRRVFTTTRKQTWLRLGALSIAYLATFCFTMLGLLSFAIYKL